ncbi:hypothetical protein OG474_06740 [Kribbella sp. NBC_01505]|uniref:hypothetical protein n=1 Tax=Kribbella sp. NBC_01505 TaxID=2903580 RepID=UPI00386ADCE7
MRRLIATAAVALSATAVLTAVPAAAVETDAHQPTRFTCYVKYNRTPYYVNGVQAGVVDAGQGIWVDFTGGGYYYGQLWGDPPSRVAGIFEPHLSCPV